MIEFLKKYFISRKEKRLKKKFNHLYKKFVPQILSDINALEAGNDLLVKLHGSGAKSVIIDSILFYKYAILDIVGLANIWTNTNQAEENLIVRLLAGTLYEFLDDSRYFLSKKFRVKMAAMPYSERYLYEFDNIADIFRLINDEFLKMLGDIRNNTAFHKSKDPRIFKKVKDDINEVHFGQVVLSTFYLWIKINKFHRLFLNCILEYEKDKQHK
ncbi:hypothetical protein [uncultured Mucilaginibacter sp.]|uniref:hypothetical protein n=1 Tax=uncultured Mucilaginibacter sp. TaxID=797541 RepID=UPI00260964AB|nr:hypothetical protein [uncultured Mucilaginibacter sp.]